MGERKTRVAYKALSERKGLVPQKESGEAERMKKDQAKGGLPVGMDRNRSKNLEEGQTGLFSPLHSEEEGVVVGDEETYALQADLAALEEEEKELREQTKRDLTANKYKKPISNKVPTIASNQNIQMQYMASYSQTQHVTQHYGPTQYALPHDQMIGYSPQYVEPRVQMQSHSGPRMIGYGPQQYVEPRVQMQDHPGSQMIPASQHIARDETTPMPREFEEADTSTPSKKTTKDTIKKHPISMCVIITMRIISAIFIIFDSVLSWWHFVTLSGGSELLSYFDLFKSVISSKSEGVKGKVMGALECADSGDTWIALKATFTAISTVWACFQLINMIGETILEYQLSRKNDQKEDIANTPDNQAKGKPNTCFHGFQILHGWMDTLVSLLCGDVPQVIIAIALGFNCDVDTTTLAQTILWMIVKSWKNDIRKATCKHKYKSCCGYCFEDCFVYYFDFPFVCTVIIFRLCGVCTGKECVESETYDLCPGGFCTRGGHCCSNMDDDPDWAKRLSKKLGEFYYFACVVAIVLMIF